MGNFIFSLWTKGLKTQAKKSRMGLLIFLKISNSVCKFGKFPFSLNCVYYVFIRKSFSTGWKVGKDKA